MAHGAVPAVVKAFFRTLLVLSVADIKFRNETRHRDRPSAPGLPTVTCKLCQFISAFLYALVIGRLHPSQ